MKEEEKTVFISESKTEPSITTREAYLVVVKGGAVGGKKYRLSTGVMVVGRSSETDICLDQTSISRKHAEINLDTSCTKATINDLASLNGTFYKGKRVKSVEIFDGEQITFGEITCKFVTTINAESKLLDFACVDEMTKTYNRRYFNDLITAEFKKSVQSKSPLSLIMFDIDKFKKINDNYGHSAGDYILKALCGIIFPMLEEAYLFARIGGEEFAILMPGVKVKPAKELAEKIRVEIEGFEFVYSSDRIPVTLSLGVAERSNDLKDHEELMSKADSLLYLAKNTGRNRACA